MNKNDFQKFKKLLDSLSNYYQQKTVLDPIAVKIYFGALEKYSLKVIEDSIRDHVKNPSNGQFFPKASDLIRYIEGDVETRSLQAWNEAMGALKRYGPDRSMQFKNRITMQTLKTVFGGWVSFCKITEDEMPFRCKDFCTMYEGYLGKDQTNFPEKLTGVSDAHNEGLFNKFVRPLVFIGDGPRPKIEKPKEITDSKSVNYNELFKDVKKLA